MRSTARGLSRGDRVAIRRRPNRSAQRGTIVDVKGDVVEWRADRSGGVFLARVDEVKRILRPRVARGAIAA